jgi:hypothetical protein
VTITQKDSPLIFGKKRINTLASIPGVATLLPATEPVNGLSLMELSGRCIFGQSASSADQVKIQFNPVVL